MNRRQNDVQRLEIRVERAITGGRAVDIVHSVGQVEDEFCQGDDVSHGVAGDWKHDRYFYVKMRWVDAREDITGVPEQAAKAVV